MFFTWACIRQCYQQKEFWAKSFCCFHLLLVTSSDECLSVWKMDKRRLFVYSLAVYWVSLFIYSMTFYSSLFAAEAVFFIVARVEIMMIHHSRLSLWRACCIFCIATEWRHLSHKNSGDGYFLCSLNSTTYRGHKFNYRNNLLVVLISDKEGITIQ